jgi:methylated-DNA-[protein]-cysteine S-methyltransferase
MRAGTEETLTTVMNTPIGTIVIEGTDRSVTGIDLPDPSAPRNLFGAIALSDAPGAVALAADQLQQYFDGARTDFDLPLEVVGTPFQRDVWLALAEIPFGKTVSYSELATMVGRPRACRAVGQANGSNPIPIVLPCHRVVASGGTIGGYGGGLRMKRQLLALEGVTLPD